MARDLISSEIRDFDTEQNEMQQLVDANVREMTDDERTEFLDTAREMALLREQKARLSKREATLKKYLMEKIAIFGLPTGSHGQHRTIEFPTPLRGLARFVRQERVSQTTDEIAAEGIARSKGIYDRLFKEVTIRELDEDAVMVAVREGLLTEDDLDVIFPKKMTYAFVAEKK